MRIDIDFSIFTSAPSAEGVISGKIELNALPRTGEVVSFLASPNGHKFPAASEFDPLLKVENVTHQINSQLVMLQLQDVVLPNKTSVGEFTTFLEQGFGLFFDPVGE
ncbi:hypothetical protein ACTCUN_13140 [Stutzerimonas balearica]|uniref:hypothetical protein n=1 Tax=Stutzerimonas balearica TaxID=74829 RepID=UPI003F758C14